MCTHCAFAMLQKMEEFVEAQEGGTGIIDLLTSAQITNRWIEELRHVLHDENLFSASRMYGIH